MGPILHGVDHLGGKGPVTLIVQDRNRVGVVVCHSQIIVAVTIKINRARARNVTALIVIKADGQASFGVMQDVMKTMQENSLERFLIITDLEVEAEEA